MTGQRDVRTDRQTDRRTPDCYIEAASSDNKQTTEYANEYTFLPEALQLRELCRLILASVLVYSITIQYNKSIYNARTVSRSAESYNIV